MAKRTNNIAEELTNRSRRFWYGLFYVLNSDKEKPVHGEEVVGIAFDNNYTLELDEKSVTIYETENKANKSSVKRNQKAKFPYGKLLDWYLHDSYLDKLE